MTAPDRHADTSDDAECFEREQLARDADQARRRIDDLPESEARKLIADLLEDDTVVAVPTDRMLVHAPTNTVFEDVVQLAAYHQGWEAGRDDGVDA
ncbi:hypothetical protein EFA46_014600 (plasmid) [Halarchaeum sp. CBA1220]|uniref:hypothetical protein n=1 Tax=Halarchaeum sp. CBA1220 TaxID=1853682 RepID=UPI0015A4C756|nr:hypothetical protein [Halarchaeum sp. CBA1220]QLC35472.1 hypothetical protein EFA46_014600 [Halarchaeum sp. CBA1220]